MRAIQAVAANVLAEVDARRDQTPVVIAAEDDDVGQVGADLLSARQAQRLQGRCRRDEGIASREPDFTLTGCAMAAVRSASCLNRWILYLS